MQIMGTKLSLRVRFWLICALTLICIGANIFVAKLEQNSQDQIEVATEERFKAHQLASELKRSVEDLHNTLINYITFADPEYARKYSDIQMILAGTKARPANYNELYRNTSPDYAFEQLNLDPDRSLLTHIRESGLAEDELAPLLAATDDYATMVEKQEQIIALVQENPDQAIEVSKSADYQNNVNSVMRPVIDFINFQERKHQNIITSIATKQEYYETIQNITLILAVLLILIAMIIMHKFIVSPITTLAETIEKEGNQDGKSIADLIVFTKNAFDQLRSKTSEQYKTEQKLITTIRQLEKNDDSSNYHDGEMFGYWSVDVKTRAIYWSEAAIRILGFDPEEKIAPATDLLLSIIHPDDRQSMREAIDRSAISERPVNTEFRIHTYKGELRYISSRGNLLHDENGVPSFLHGTIVDVTDRKRALQEAKELETRLLEAQRISNIGSWNYSLVDESLFWSDEVYRILGLEPDSIVPTYDDFVKYLHKDDVEFMEKAVQDTIEKGKEYNVEHRIVREDGEIRYINAQGEITYAEDGSAKSLNGTMHDITARKLAELATQELKDRLLEAQRIASMGTWNTDLITNQAYWSDELYRICGLEPQSLSNPREVFYDQILHPDDQDYTNERLSKAIKAGGKYEIDFRIVRPSGEIRHIHSMGEINHDEDGTPLSFNGVFHDITEQKRMEDELKTSQDFMAEAQRIASFGTWSWNLESDQFRCSEETIRMMGATDTREIDTMKKVIRFIHPTDQEKSTQGFMNALKSGKDSYGLDIRIIHPDGSIRFVLLQAEIQRTKDNWATEVIGTILDITERKQAEEAARISGERLLEAQRLAGIGNWQWDCGTNEVFWSDQLYEIYGYDKSKTKASNDNFRRILHPDDVEKVDRVRQNALEFDEPFIVEHRLILDSGDIRTVVQRAEVTRRKSGDPKYITGTLQDITELKKAEELAKESEARLSEIFNIAPAAIITADHELKITIFNKAAAEIFEYEPDQVIGEHINILIPEKFHKSHEMKIDEFNNSGGMPRNMSDRAGIYGQKKNGVIFPAAASVSSTGKGVDRIYTIILLDTTERQRIEEERLNALTQAQEANRAKSRFLATMSHELRTPLNAIIGFSEMMTNRVFGKLGSKKYEDYAADIVSSSRHLLNLVNDILDLSEIESGKKNLKIDHHSLRDTVDECRPIITKLADDKKISCTFDIPDDLSNIYADQRALQQVIINLMTNSVKYTPKGGAVNLQASTNGNNEHILTISDNGKGIPEEKLHDIMHPFSRVENDPYKAQDGKGLGLAIVQSLMNLHGGDIEINSTFGEGTTVKVHFPNKTFH